jgi:hypothetical protein
MKKRLLVNQNLFCFLTLLLLVSFSTKAQSFGLRNLLCGTVVVGYEIDDQPNMCGVCAFGTATIAPSSTYNLPACSPSGFGRICIWLVSIDGVSVGVGADCHNDCTNGQFCCGQVCPGGTTPSTSSCSPSTPYNLVITPGVSWQIQ